MLIVDGTERKGWQINDAGRRWVEDRLTATWKARGMAPEEISARLSLLAKETKFSATESHSDRACGGEGHTLPFSNPRGLVAYVSEVSPSPLAAAVQVLQSVPPAEEAAQLDPEDDDTAQRIADMMRAEGVDYFGELVDKLRARHAPVKVEEQ
jgi:hypothetical protein